MKQWLSWLLVMLVGIAVGPAQVGADELDPRVMVLPVEGGAPEGLGALPDDVGAALVRGAARTTTTVAQATASLSDTAVIVGCDPELPACRDAVAAALNVDQLLLARIAGDGEEASVEVTAVTREGEPVVRTFAVRSASRAEDLAAMEREVPLMLEAGEVRRRDGGTGTGTGAGTGASTGTETGTATETGAATGTETETETGRSRGPLIVAAAGVVVVAIGGVSWALASAVQGDIDDAPTQTAADLDRLAGLEDTARLRATVGNVLVAAGLLTVAGGVSWWLWDRRRAADRPAVSVGPAVFAGGGGLAVGGQW